MPPEAMYDRRMGLSRRLAFACGVILTFSLALAAVDPYPPPANAASDLQRARERARRSGKLLMVVFGGNWCPDCRALHDRMHESPVREYVEARFETVNVNIGEMDANLGIAKDLGVNLKKGVPAAAFFAADGKPVGITNQGELEPARQYNAQQVLAFLHRVAEQHSIQKPR
jgi:thioredoxin-related protein